MSRYVRGGSGRAGGGQPRLAIVVSHPIQHFCPLYRVTTEDGRVVQRVFFGSSRGLAPYFGPGFAEKVSWGSDLVEGFDHVFLDDQAGGTGSFTALWRSLTAWRPDVLLVYGYSEPISRAAAAWGRAHGVPMLYTSDSAPLQSASTVRRIGKRLVVPLVLRQFRGFVTIGDQNEEYYESVGVPQRRFFRSPIPIDSPALDAVLRDARRVRAEVRASWGLHEDEVALLAVGKSVPRKRHADLILAAAALPSTSPAVPVLAGGGPEMAALQDLAAGLDQRAVFAGFVPPRELFRFYVGADVLIHPSQHDPHPLAVAEAVYCGLPVVVSDQVGSWGPTDDARAENGVRFPVGDVQALSHEVQRLVSDRGGRAAMAAASRRIGAARSLATSAESLVEAVLAVSRRPRG